MTRKPLRITHVVENLERGGLERVVIDLALEQAGQGNAVQVICLFGEGQLAHELIAAGIPVIACHKGRGLDFAVLQKIRRLLREHATQILHSHNPMPHYYGVVASIFLKGIRIGNTRHGMGNAPFHVRREFLFRASLVKTSFVATVCESARRNFIHYKIVTEAKARVVPNGIRFESFESHSARGHESLAQMLKLRPATVCIGIVGRLNPVKDHATLLHAMVRVRAAIAHAVLIIVGGGRLQGELETLTKQLGLEAAVYFLGDRNDVNTLLPGFDIFVLPSLSEGYSIALLEACASGLPIVATDVGGNAEIVKAGINGLLVASGNADELADAVITLAEDGELRLAMGKRGRDWVTAYGTIERMAQSYAELYRDGVA
jgi:glycosyltransferase involved in cell wall biosynthesis